MVFGALALLGLAGVGALAVVLPRLVNTPEFRAALAQRAGDALGSPVEWKSLEIGLFPPRVVVEGPKLVGQPEAADEARIGAERIDLRLSLWPLLARRVAVDSLVLHGVDLVATRTPDGLVLPSLGRRDEAAAPDATGETPAGDGAFSLDLRSLRIDSGRILVHDRTLSPPVDWRLDALALEARGESLGSPLEIEATTKIFADDRALGAVASHGRITLEGEYDLALDLDGLPVAELAAFVPDPQLVAGELSGPLSVAGRKSELSRLTADLAIAGLVFRTRGLELAGDLELRAQRRAEGALGLEADWSAADSGGQAKVTGERAANGDLSLTAMLEGLELAPFAPLLGPDRTLSGRASGEVSLATVAGPTGTSVDRVETDLAIDSARYADGRIDAKGKLDLAVGLEGLAPEDALRIQAVFAPESGGRLDLNGTGTVSGPLRSALRFDAFDVAPIAPLLPEGTQVAGKLTGELEIDATAERELSRLAGHLRVGAARLVRAPVDVAGDLALDARVEGEGPIELEAKASLADGGRVELAGQATRKGVLDLALSLTNFDLAAVMPFVGSKDLSLAGRATGKGRITGAYDAPERLVLDLALADTAIRRADLKLDGPFTLKLDATKPLAEERRGRVDLDLGLADVAWGTAFTKPAGVRAELGTKFESGAGGALGFQSQGRLNDIAELSLRGSLGEATDVTLTTSSFELKGWSGLVPALASYSPQGSVAFEDFRLVRAPGSRDRFAGRIALRGVDLSLSGERRVRLRGNLVGDGPRIETNALSATLYGLTLGLDGHVDDPLVEAKFAVAAHSIGEAEANELVSGLTSARDLVFGALRFDAKLEGMAGGEPSVYDTLAGNVRFTIGESGGGRLRGVSLLKTTLGQIPLLGGAAAIAERLRAVPVAASMPGAPGAAAVAAGASLAPDYLGERFELVEGDLVIAAGELDARTLRLRYRGYEARLAGHVTLADLALDMRGELLLDPPVVALLARRPESSLAGRGPVRIPLARVGNTLADPKVSLTVETLAAVPQLLLLTGGVDQIVGKTVGGVVEKVGGAVGRTGGQLGEAIGKVGEAVGRVGGLSTPTVPREPTAPPAPPAPSTPPAVPTAPAPVPTAPADSPTDGSSEAPDAAEPAPEAPRDAAPADAPAATGDTAGAAQASEAADAAEATRSTGEAGSP